MLDINSIINLLDNTNELTQHRFNVLIGDMLTKQESCDKLDERVAIMHTVSTLKALQIELLNDHMAALTWFYKRK